MISEKGSTKIVNLITTRSGVLVLGHVVMCSENAVFLSIYYAPIAIDQTFQKLINGLQNFVNVNAQRRGSCVRAFFKIVIR